MHAARVRFRSRCWFTLVSILLHSRFHYRFLSNSTAGSRSVTGICAQVPTCRLLLLRRGGSSRRPLRLQIGSRCLPLRRRGRGGSRHALRSQLRRRGGRACRMAGGLVESGQSATRRAIGRRIGVTAGLCDADAAPFNDAAGGIEVTILDQHVQPSNCGRCCQQVEGVEQLEI